MSQVGWAHLVEVRRPALAGYLDRVEIVSGVVGYRLRLASGDSWGEPLSDMVARLLSEDLADRLRGSIVFTETSPISAVPDAVVSVDIQRFDAGEDGTVTLLAEISVESSPNHASIGSRRVELRLRPSGYGTAGLVSAMSNLLGQLADNVAVFLGGPPPGSSASAAAVR
jgi:uncharacterized lipoprotein YmbA